MKLAQIAAALLECDLLDASMVGWVRAGRALAEEKDPQDLIEKRIIA
jgi:hypothetical protein